MIPATKPFLSDRQYNALKWIAQIFLPALATFYFTLSEIWNLPYGLQVVGTITAFDLFLGLLLGVSTKAYNASGAQYDGQLLVTTEDGVPYKMEAQLKELENPMDIAEKEKLTLKVDKIPEGHDPY